MELNLKKPIAFFDLETTGINIASDRIVEISVIKIQPNGKEEWFTKRVNPGIPIPAQTTAIHGISDARTATVVLRDKYIFCIVFESPRSDEK